MTESATESRAGPIVPTTTVPTTTLESAPDSGLRPRLIPLILLLLNRRRGATPEFRLRWDVTGRWVKHR